MIASLVVNEQIKLNAPPRPADHLRGSPPGPYTVTVVNNDRIEAWNQHVERLATAIGALCSLSKEGATCADQQYAGLAASIAAARGQQSLQTYVAELIKPSVVLAIAQREAQPGSDPDAPCLLTILLHPSLGARCAALPQPPSTPQSP